MNVVISCLYYENTTGSELYIFELAHELLARGHKIAIHASEIGGEIFNHTSEDIRVSPRATPRETPDIVLAQHYTFSEDLINNTNAPVVYTVHSEVIPDENPIKNDKIKKYIAVREPIADRMINEFSIPANMIEVVPNGVNLDRFKPSDEPKEYGLIPANFNGWREPFMKRMINEIKDEKMLFVGNGLNFIPNAPNVEKKSAVWDVENLYKKAKWAAGLFQGRTMYEAWACQIPFKSYGWKGEDYPMERPENFEEIYGLKQVVDRLEQIYMEACRN